MLIQNNKLHIVIELNAKIPAIKYGGTERVVWDLGKALTEKGHRVTFLVAKGSYCDFADVKILDNEIGLAAQIPKDADVVHLNAHYQHDVSKPYLITIHGNPSFDTILDQQSVFVSRNHAERYGSSSSVYNGLDWRNYPAPNLKAAKSGFHFLGKAAWKVKNLKGAIQITKKAGGRLNVLGGYRFNFKMGWRFTFDTHVSFKGMVDNQQKAKYLQKSKGLIFPVLWNEPFGLALIESLYYGCPVFGTPYGSLPEIISKDYGFLANQEDELVKAIENIHQYDAEKCHQYAKEKFSASAMADEYLKLYEKVINGEELNKTNPQLKEKNQTRFLPYYS